MAFLMANLSTIVISLILIGVVCLIIRTMIRDRKAGKGCGGCPGGCHSCHGSCGGHEISQGHGEG